MIRILLLILGWVMIIVFVFFVWVAVQQPWTYSESMLPVIIFYVVCIIYIVCIIKVFHLAARYKEKK